MPEASSELRGNSNATGGFSHSDTLNAERVVVHRQSLSSGGAASQTAHIGSRKSFPRSAPSSGRPTSFFQIS
jgi:hypothetical protein